MHVLLLAFGSRGDVQPFIALGRGLKAAGYDVRIGAGTNFEAWIRAEGFDYAPVNVDIEAFTNSDAGRDWQGSSSQNPLAEVVKMRRAIRPHALELGQDVVDMTQPADVLISGLIGCGMMDAIAKTSNKTHIQAFLQPVAPTRAGYATMQSNFDQQNSWLNRVSGYITAAAMWYIMGQATNIVRSDVMNIAPQSMPGYVRMLTNTPTLYGISPHVMPEPDDWADHLHVTGYWFYDAASDYTPPADLQAFIEQAKGHGVPLVYMGFGSMASADPAATARLMIDALQQTGVRGIIYRGWAGLTADDVPDNVFLLEGAPHDWLFPQMDAIVHHGGAGTTAAGLRAGVPALIVSHIGDQPYWGKRLYRLGVGLPHIPRHKLTTQNLAQAITQLTTDPTMRTNAHALGQKIRAEDGVQTAVDRIGAIIESNLKGRVKN